MRAFVSESKDDSQRSVKKKKKHCIIYILCQALSLFSAFAQAQHIKAEEMSRTETAATYSVDDISGVDVLQREENVH